MNIFSKFYGFTEYITNDRFSTDDGKIAGRNPTWVNKTLIDMVKMFESVGIQTKLGKTKAMMCTPGSIWV